MRIILSLQDVMIVCSCRGITCRRIKQEVQDGAHTVKAVALRCGAVRSCGACSDQIRGLIAEVLAGHTCERTAESSCPNAPAGDKPAAA